MRLAAVCLLPGTPWVACGFLPPAGDGGHLGFAQPEEEGRADIRLAGHLDVPAHAFEDFAGDGQSQTCAGRSGCVEWVENPIQLL